MDHNAVSRHCKSIGDDSALRTWKSPSLKAFRAKDPFLASVDSHAIYHAIREYYKQLGAWLCKERGPLCLKTTKLGKQSSYDNYYVTGAQSLKVDWAKSQFYLPKLGQMVGFIPEFNEDNHRLINSPEFKLRSALIQREPHNKFYANCIFSDEFLLSDLHNSKRNDRRKRHKAVIINQNVNLY
jgi:hypothetical protein